MNDAQFTHFPRCMHTGVTIPECSCRHCCEAQLRRYAPWLLTKDEPRFETELPASPAELPATPRHSRAREHCLSEKLEDQFTFALLDGAC